MDISKARLFKLVAENNNTLTELVTRAGRGRWAGKAAPSGGSFRGPRTGTEARMMRNAA